MDFQLNFLVPGIYLCVEEGIIGHMLLCNSFTASYLNRSVWMFSSCVHFVMTMFFSSFSFLNSDF